MSLTTNAPFTKGYEYIYLASQSPRRQELLKQIDVKFELLLPSTDEDSEELESVEPNEDAMDYVKRVTLKKMEKAFERIQQRKLPIAPVICSDTTVVLDGEIFGKPKDEGDAFRMLEQLQGKTHQVLTAVAISAPSFGTEDNYLNLQGSPLQVSQSTVTLAPMSPLDIKAYVKSGEPMGKAGAYAIQGRMAAYIKHIEGSYSGIMGLPLYETAGLLGLSGVKRS